MEEINTKKEAIEERSKPLLEELKELKEFKEKTILGDNKKNKIRIPRKAKVRKRSLKLGYVGILRINENGNITGEKQRITGSSLKDSEGLYHATDRRETLFWEGKYPVIILPSWKNNPISVNPEEDKNETYGQPYIKAKMLADTIKVKQKGGGSIIIWILVAGAALFGLNYIMGGGLFG